MSTHCWIGVHWALQLQVHCTSTIRNIDNSSQDIFTQFFLLETSSCPHICLYISIWFDEFLKKKNCIFKIIYSFDSDLSLISLFFLFLQVSSILHFSSIKFIPDEYLWMSTGTQKCHGHLGNLPIPRTAREQSSRSKIEVESEGEKKGKK